MNYMKTIISLCLLVIHAASGAAQDIPPDRMERFNAQRVAFFTERLRLTSEEAQVFWPIYYEYQDEKNRIIEERKEMTRNLVQNQRTLSDAEIEQIGDKYVESVKKEAELLEIYHSKFKETLPIRKVMRIYSTETQFKNFLLRQIQQPRQIRNPGRM
ncbi:MAG: hypothetical protein JSV24_04415 [Bacteroidales bacterium]|nr:MAG: hypothetical protein JSV24_04415 [Bacteroidales bacterium]